MTLTHHTMHTSHRHTHHTLAHSKVSWSTAGLWIPVRSPEEMLRVHVDTPILTLWI